MWRIAWHWWKKKRPSSFTVQGMKDMLDGKISELMAGASTAWVPSPAAATLHSLHYHHVNVPERQMQLAMRPAAKIELLLEPPLLDQKLSEEEINHELKENAQSILGCLDLIHVKPPFFFTIMYFFHSSELQFHCFPFPCSFFRTEAMWFDGLIWVLGAARSQISATWVWWKTAPPCASVPSSWPTGSTMASSPRCRRHVLNNGVNCWSWILLQL